MGVEVHEPAVNPNHRNPEDSMPNPVLARNDEAGDRFYPWKGQSYYSVTTIIGGGVPKYALAPWYGKTVAELVAADIMAHGSHARAHAAVRRWAKLGRLDVIRRQADGALKSIKIDKLTELDLALRWLKGEPERQRDAAAAVGIDVHSEAEDLVLRLALDESFGNEAEWPERLAGHEASFHAWLRDWNPIYVAAEATVFNLTQAYAGTLDAIVRVHAHLLIEALVRLDRAIPPWLLAVGREGIVTLVLDYKAGRDVHPEVGLQLAPYARADFIGLPDGVTEEALPVIHGGAVLHITPNGYRLRLVDIGPRVYDAFLFAREVYRFKKEIAATVLSPDLAPKRERVAA